MNLNILFSLAILLQAIGILTALSGFVFRKNRTTPRLLLFTGHCLFVLLFFQWLGHLIGIGTLYIANHSAIGVFRAHQTFIPEEGRVNGEWILEEPSFHLQPAERAILVDNYQKMSPCLFENGFCYFELGGFLHNSAGNALRVAEQADFQARLGFSRIRGHTNIIGNWYYYH